IKTPIPAGTVSTPKPQEIPKAIPPRKTEDLSQQGVKPPQEKSMPTPIQTTPTPNPKSVGFKKK
ncbi:MAG TPA: hypothetical protein PLX23_13505, partial [Candidatus Hydrogenedens sp.]|nr:hypothetical protein [Candidatus Hydrogenedens sp.]